MYSRNIILPSSKFIGFVGLIFCLTFHAQVFAQSDRETVIQEREKKEFSEKAQHSKKKQVSVEEDNSYSPREKGDSKILKRKKEAEKQHLGYSEEKDVYEVKEGDKSSVTFNIFLYVLDRFKEN